MEAWLEQYSRAHRHFLVDELSPLLQETAAAAPRGTIADLGSGEGATLWALRARGLLGARTYAVDLSRQRVAAAERVVPGARGIVADATHVPELEDCSLDGAIVAQVIEHIPHQDALAPELARLLRPGGWWYVSSVLRGPRAWWLYRVEGQWRLDPTHVREYRSVSELLDVLAHEQLEVTAVRTAPITYALLDLALRAAARGRPRRLDRLPSVYRSNQRLLWLRFLRARVPGYRLIEVAGRRTG